MTHAGYGFVPLSPEVRRVARVEATWDRRVRGTLSGAIELTLIAQQRIHVGSGGKQVVERSVVHRHARVRGGPGIPGSSFRGALRARYEAITRSCAPLAPTDKRYDIRSSTTDIEVAYLRQSALSAPVLQGGCTVQRACPACALFGRMSLRSRITVTDFACTGDTEFEIARMPQRFGPNLHHIGPAAPSPSGDAFEVRGLHGRKFGLGRGLAADQLQHVEVIPAGSTFAGQLRLGNVTPAELGGVLAALGCDPASAIKLGGGKSLGFGRVQCQARCLITGHGAPASPEAWRAQFVASPDRWPDGEDRLVALHTGDC